MRPDPEVMHQFLLHLFGNQMRGQVELAWRNANTGQISQAVLFHLDNLDELVERAVEVNSVEGQNIYCGAALRAPETAPFGRAKDEDFLCAPAYWADLDLAPAVAAARERSGSAPANLAVITGRHPHPRAQLYWRVEEAVTDPGLLRRQNAAIAAALDGDASVCNPSRLMRFAGSVAWPAKGGRVAEMTEMLTWPNRPAAYVEGEVEQAFPADKAAPLKVSTIFTNGSSPERWVELLRDGCAEGERNTTAAALAGYLLRRDIRPPIAWEILSCANALRFRPPLGEDELNAVFESICSAELKRRGAA